MNDLKRRKFHFCLAFCTVFIVVISTLVVKSVTSKGPIVFMKLAEQDSGEIDGLLVPRFMYADTINDMNSL